MIQCLPRTLLFDEFLEWYPDQGGHYELIDGVMVEMRPAGDHEELADRITRLLDREIERQNLPYLTPKSCCIKPKSFLI